MVRHPAHVAQLLEAIEHRHQRSRRHAEPAGELPARLASPAAHGHEGAELRHGQVDVHEEPRGVIGEGGALPPECVQDRAHVGDDRVVGVWSQMDY
jgi:hypothetical protein